MSRKELFSGTYMSLFDDKTIGVSDGVGFVGAMELDEVEELYLALDKLFKGEKQ